MIIGHSISKETARGCIQVSSVWCQKKRFQVSGVPPQADQVLDAATTKSI